MAGLRPGHPRLAFLKVVDARHNEWCGAAPRCRTLRSLDAPPGVPADRVAMLRKAFMDTMADKEFLAEAEKAQLEITPIDGASLQKLVTEVYQTPAAIAHKAAEFLR